MPNLINKPILPLHDHIFNIQACVYIEVTFHVQIDLQYSNWLVSFVKYNVVYYYAPDLIQ